MWLNKAAAKAGRVFLGSRGLRCGWRAAAACALYYAWNTLATAFFTWIFALFFDAWGVNTLNLHLAPLWVRAAVNGYPYAVSILVNAPAALAFMRLARGMTNAAPRPLSAAFLAAGAGAAIVPAAAFILIDSIRLTPASPSFHWAVLASAPMYFIAAWSEQALSRGYVSGIVSKALGVPAAYVVSAAVFIVMNGAWSMGGIGFANMLILGVLLMAVTERFGAWCAVMLRAGFVWAANSVASFSENGFSVFSLYPVSENIITGGESGLMCGIFMTALLVVCTWLILKKRLRLRMPRLHKRVKRVKSPMT